MMQQEQYLLSQEEAFAENMNLYVSSSENSCTSKELRAGHIKKSQSQTSEISLSKMSNVLCEFRDGTNLRLARTRPSKYHSRSTSRGSQKSSQ